MKKISIPVFMYHSIGIPSPSWHLKHLTMHYMAFEEQLKYLKDHGYNTITLDELYDHVHNNINIKNKSVVLTFDDGYVDNYIFAYPLLKKYEFRGTIFVNPEFVEKREIVRKRFDENIDLENNHFNGFLSWNEMLIMERDGIIDIESHAMTHTWYPISDNIIDFRNPNDNYIWMTWNKYPELKPYLQCDDHKLIDLGAPVYKHEKSLLARRYFPDENIEKLLNDYVNKNGGREFFNNDNWKNILYKLVSNYKNKNILDDSYESDDMRLRRIHYELVASKNIIEENLNKKVEYLCWPGGSGSKEGVMIAEEVGYKMTTAAMDLNNRRKIKNDGKYGKNRIKRTSTNLKKIRYNNKAISIPCDKYGMWLKINIFKSNGIINITLRGVSVIYGLLKYYSKYKCRIYGE